MQAKLASRLRIKLHQIKREFIVWYNTPGVTYNAIEYSDTSNTARLNEWYRKNGVYND